MDKENNLTEDIQELKENIQKEFQEMYKQGYAAGAVTTCGVLYKTFQLVGLEETNILFTILKDIARNNGCEDLSAYTKSIT